MKISKIEFENFRNFKNYGEIKCSTDGKVTIIYGRNGDGKTTLHQLFKWIFYDKVSFNKTATSKLYNLKFEREQEYGSFFDVMGRVDFEHEGNKYSITRKYTYQKGLSESTIKHREVSLNKMDNDNNWKRVDNPEKVIERLLPEALSEYFFFDGESMIADLRVKEKESASKLKKALFSMFDLDAIESAINHIGDIDKKTTVLGKLYLQKAPITSSSEAIAVRTNIENTQNKLDSLNKQITESREKKEELHAFIKDVSEAIGTTKSKAEYEAERRALQHSRDSFINNSKMMKESFGETIIDIFPQLLISKTVEKAKEKIHLEIEKNKLPHGLSKTLIKYLTSEKVTECVCGNPLTSKEKEHIKKYLDLLPPNTYTNLYNEFSMTAKAWGKDYDKDRIESYIVRVLDNDEQAAECDVKIKDLDEIQKNNPDIENLVEDRQKAEREIAQLDEKIVKNQASYDKYELYLKQQMKKFDQLTKDSQTNESVERKISIMQSVLNYFEDRKETATKEYSSKLQDNIQDLLNKMLTSKRSAYVSPEFSVRVTDSEGDESKSEGQFAVVSFAYIGGILKMLRSKESLSNKEYPLVLDGPFSKLDPIQRQNVVDSLPEFAPQVIVFSKDDLQEVFDENQVGSIWTITSNAEKNVAEVKEGYLWK